MPGGITIWRVGSKSVGTSGFDVLGSGSTGLALIGFAASAAKLGPSSALAAAIASARGSLSPAMSSQALDGVSELGARVGAGSGLAEAAGLAFSALGAAAGVGFAAAFAGAWAFAGTGAGAGAGVFAGAGVAVALAGAWVFATGVAAGAVVLAAASRVLAISASSGTRRTVSPESARLTGAALCTCLGAASFITTFAVGASFASLGTAGPDLSTWVLERALSIDTSPFSAWAIASASASPSPLIAIQAFDGVAWLSAALVATGTAAFALGTASLVLAAFSVGFTLGLADFSAAALAAVSAALLITTGRVLSVVLAALGSILAWAGLLVVAGAGVGLAAAAGFAWAPPLASRSL